MKDMKQTSQILPEKTFQDSQKTTEQLTSLSQSLGKAEAEVKILKEKLAKEDKKITVTIKDADKGDTGGFFHVLHGMIPVATLGAKVASIEVNNVDEVDKFLEGVLESEISQERDELQEKYKKLELKLDEKDNEISKHERQLSRIKIIHDNQLEDLRQAYKADLTKVRKTANSKVEKQLIQKDVEYANLQNKLDLERQEANLRETDLLGKLDIFKQANEVLESKVVELKAQGPRLLGTLGNYINKMIGYKKAIKELNNFESRSKISGRMVRGSNPFTISW